MILLLDRLVSNNTVAIPNIHEENLHCRTRIKNRAVLLISFSFSITVD